MLYNILKYEKNLKNLRNLKMSVLKLTITILTIAGCWQPFMLTSLIKRTLYNAYTLLLISIMYTFACTQFMDIVLNVDNPEDLTSTLYSMLIVFVSCYKIVNFWMDHDSVAALIRNLTEGLFKPLVPEEMVIQRRFDKMIQ